MSKPVEEAQERTRKLVDDFKRKPLWWREIVYVLGLYAIYTVVRNIHGSVLSITTAERNALDVVHLQERLHIFNEERIQHFFLSNTTLIKALNVYYGTAHFIVTIGVLLWLFHFKVERYHRWRNVIFATTGLALIGYMTYPLAPPRLLPEHYGIVDTLRAIGGPWSFESGPVKNVSNQYAAMPSLHVSWALWCAFAVFPTIQNRFLRPLVFLYPALTILTIIVTGNHYWADVAGGVFVFMGGCAIAALGARHHKARRPDMTEDDIALLGNVGAQRAASQ